jgi:hypothetical protein
MRHVRGTGNTFLKAAREAARNNVELEEWLNVVLPKLGPKQHVKGCRTAEQFMQMLKAEYQAEYLRYTEERSNQGREEKLSALLGEDNDHI